jgi:thiol:disulfide interchange protein/DsbC/DsbD-like thiol-disulfide interchange protein
MHLRTMRLAGLIYVAWACLLASPLQAAHTRASLLLQADTVKPGDTVLASVLLRMDSGWHTYWKNSGASGLPTRIAWKLPPSITAGDIQWPLPEKLPEQELTTYIYRNEALLLVPLTVGTNADLGVVSLEAEVSWLECDVQCVQGSAQVRANMTIGLGTKAAKDTGLFEKWQKRFPVPAPADLQATASWEAPAQGNSRSLLIAWSASVSSVAVDFFPYESEHFEVQGPTTNFVMGANRIIVRKEVKKIDGEWPQSVAGVIVQGSGEERKGYEVTLPVLATASLVSAVGSAPIARGTGSSYWIMLLYAFIGGLILNVMPCVLPVIALKILGFVNQSKDGPSHIRKLGILYALGVLVSFLALAAMVIAVKAAGHKAGWGMQFGNPMFLVVLTVLVTLVALNLFGLFEVTAGSQVMGAASTLSSRHGSSGAFFNGVLATLLATPCTAPFLGAALGFAFAQPAAGIVLFFLTVGLGLAAPYVVLSFQPGWLKFLPKPGAWMEKFKIAMGFPMLATAMWLFSLLSDHYGERSWWLGLFLVILALAAWVFGQFYQQGRSRRGLGLAVAVAVALLGYVTVLEGQLQWRKSEAQDNTSTFNHAEPGGVAWRPWSPEALAEARAAGHPVLVDFTAKWCLTCNTIVKPALESRSVKETLEKLGVVALLGDYTRFPPRITEELNRFGRAGVPLVLVYPKDSTEPIVLPEAITPGMVVDVLQRATK